MGTVTEGAGNCSSYKGYYGNISRLKAVLAADHNTLEIVQPGQFDKLLLTWLRGATEYIDHYCRRSFLPNPPNMIHLLAERIVMNQVGYVVQNRTSPVVQINDYQVQMLEDHIITDSIKRDLALFRRRQQVYVGSINRRSG